MALSRKLYLTFAVTTVLLYVSPLTALLPPQSGMVDKEVGMRKMMVLGSRPPRCVNKCMGCRPCKATLVIPPHNNYRLFKRDYNFNYYVKSSDGSYYLLSWKCRCGDKYYQP